MAMLTVRNVPENVHRALRVRAAKHGRSTEAEVREILELAVRPDTRLKMGDAIVELARKAGVTNKDFDTIERVRDRAPAKPMRFE